MVIPVIDFVLGSSCVREPTRLTFKRIRKKKQHVHNVHNLH